MSEIEFNRRGLIGASVLGAAMVGLRPIIEFMSWSFCLVAADQIINNAPKMLYMSGGQFGCPMVFRGNNGAGGQLASTHSWCVEGLYANVPGLKIAIPSNPYDAKGMLLSAIEDDDPVVFFEPKRIYNGPFDGDPDKPARPWSTHAKGEVPEGEWRCADCCAGEQPPRRPTRLTSSWQRALFASEQLFVARIEGFTTGPDPETGGEEHQVVLRYYYRPQDTPAIVRGLYGYATQTLKYCDTHYNFFVDRYGQIFEGRYGSVWDPVRAAHTTGMNTGTVGVALIGNFQNVPAPPAAIDRPMHSSATLLALLIFIRVVTDIALTGKKSAPANHAESPCKSGSIARSLPARKR